MTPPNELEQLAEFQDAIQSNKGLERLRAMQYLQQMNNQGLMEMPQVTQQPIVQRQDGGMASPFKSNYGVRGNPALDQYNPRFDLAGTTGDEIGLLKQRELENQMRLRDEELSSDSNTLENIYKAADVIVNGGSTQDRIRSQAIYRDNPAAVQRAIDELRNPQQRAGGGQVAPDQMAQGLAGLGRYGDTMLVHMNPEEVAGLASLGTITYNPITGLPEAWGIKSFFKPFKQAAKSIKKVAKSKAFRTIAPLAITIAAPYLAAKFAPTLFGVGAKSLVAKGLAAQVAAMGPVAFGAATALGSGLGALAAGAKPQDALKAAAMSGVTAGGFRGFTNYMDPNIDSVFGPTYNQGATIDPTAGRIGDLQTSFANIDTSTPIKQNLASKTGVDFGKYGKVDSLLDSYSPEYYGPSSNINPNLGIDATVPYQMDPGLLQTNLPATEGAFLQPALPARTINIDSIPSPSSAPVDIGPTPYETLYGPSTTGQITAGGGDIGSRFTTGSGDQSYVVGGDYNYTAPTLKEQAMDALTDNKLGRAVSRAGDYLEGTAVGDIGKAIYDDYSTGTGLAKLVATDAMIPDYREQYAMEDERQRQLEELEKLGYSVELSDADTGFNQTVVIRDSSGRVMPSNLSIQDILDRALGRTPRTRLVDRTDYAPATAKQGGLVNIASNKNSKSASKIKDTQMAGSKFENMIVLQDPPWSVLPNDLNPENFMYMYTDKTTGEHYFKDINTRKYKVFGSSKLKTGGVIEKAHGGEFSGKVEGDGHGMEDNVYMPIKEGGEQVGTLAVSPSEYVVDAYTMSALGNGNADEGAKVMDGVVESVRKKAYGTIRQPKEIDGLMALKPMMAGV